MTINNKFVFLESNYCPSLSKKYEIEHEHGKNLVNDILSMLT